MKNYVGRKIRGFRGCYAESLTKDIIGKTGKIVSQEITRDSLGEIVTVDFYNKSLSYPISLIEPHLIEETPEISGLEALLIVHGGWHGKEEEMLYDKCFKIIQQERKRLQSIYIKTIPKYTHAELVEKLGHDFEYINK